MLNMLDLSIIEEDQLKKLCQAKLGQVKQQLVQFSLTLFPIRDFKNPFQLFYKNIVTYITMRINQHIPFQTAIQEVLLRAKNKNSEFHKAMDSLFKGQFQERLKKRIYKSRGVHKVPNDKTVNISEDATDRKVMTFGAKTNTVQNRSKSPVQSLKPSLNKIDNRSVNSKHSNESLKSGSKKETEKQPLTLAVKSSTINSNVGNQGGVLTNLIAQDICFCGKHVSLIEQNKQSSFLCFHCQKRYHTDCMKREKTAQSCPFCHLRRLVPNKEVKKVLFVGLLQKERKRHEINLQLTEMDMSIQYKIQVRSLRIKNECQTFILFPDAATVTMKNTNIKDYQPLHKQSSLKFRKDEPFYLSLQYLHPKDNKIMITEVQPGKDNRFDRIDAENHLFGIYLVEERKVESLINDLQKNSFTTFYQSKELIDLCFRNGNVGDEIECQMIKVPLTCSMTIEKMKLPARGVFCTHFQCFDAISFLELTCHSSYPRWVCPFCKKPAYQFKIDLILYKILEEFKSVTELSEVVFLRGGQFRVFQPKQVAVATKLNNIHDLPIEGKLKRRPPTTQAEEEAPSKKTTKEIVIE